MIKIESFDTVIFDMDGTTLNTIEDLSDSVNFILTKYGYPNRTLEEIKSFVGNGVANLIERSIPDGRNNPNFENCLSEYKDYYRDNMQNKTAPYDGIIELLKELRKKNYKLAIVSNKFDKAAKELNTKYFGGCIDVAIGESGNIKKKPAPDGVFKALKELNSTPKKAVYVGDSEVDVKTAQNAGLICIGVTWGFRDRKVLEKMGADFIIDKPEELFNILKG